MRRNVEQLSGERFDMAVVGGGMHGAWIALHAAQAGYRVALIEKTDFGAGTSGNSLQILHGGLRYLQQVDFVRMRASIAARREFARLAPHLVRPLPCLMPLQRMGLRSPWVLGPALMANDMVSWDRNKGVAEQARVPRGHLVDGETCASRIAPLADNHATTAALWWDLQALDAGRLALEPVLQAARLGAVVANHVQATGYLISEGRITGLTATDLANGSNLQINAQCVINATGPGAGELSQASGLPTAFLPPAWIGGLNLVLRRSLGIDTAVALPIRERLTASGRVHEKRRELFFVPWRNVTMVGTSYWKPGHADINAAPTAAVTDFLNDAAAAAPRAGLTIEDVARVHWGLLPLANSDDLLPARSPILVSGVRETGAEGLVVVIGEKLTSAPILAKKVLQHAARGLRPSRDKAVSGAKGRSTEDAAGKATALPARLLMRLSERYGTSWASVAAHANGHPHLLAPLLPGADVFGVEIVHAIREEMALSLQDLVQRRLGLSDAGPPDQQLLQRCADIAAQEWNWSPETTATEVKRFTDR